MVEDSHVIVEIGDEEFVMRKDRLSECSHFFRASLSHGYSESSNFDSSTLKQLLEYVNTRHLSITQSTVDILMETAVYFEMEKVIEECAKFLFKRVRYDTALPLFLFFREKNFVPISRTPLFTELSAEILLILVQRSTLHVDSEDQVFEAVDRWMGEDEEKRREASTLLKTVRCTLLSDSSITEIMEKEWVKESLECISLLKEIKENRQSVHRGEKKSSTESSRVCDDAHRLVVFINLMESFDADEYVLPPGSIASVQIYDPVKNEWTRGTIPDYSFLPDDCVAVGTKTPPSINCREESTCEVVDGRVFSPGGPDELNSCMEMLYLSSPSPAWSSLAQMLNGRESHASCVHDGKIYVFGGHGDGILRDCEMYDPHTNRWTAIAPMKRGRYSCAAASLHGFIYVVGGTVDCLNPRHRPIVPDLERYCPQTDSWTTLASMKTARRRCFLFAHNGKLLVFGRFGRNRIARSVEVYCPEKDTWEEKTVMGEWSKPGIIRICSLPIPAHFPSPRHNLEIPFDDSPTIDNGVATEEEKRQ